jgi:hypothetical protein
MATTKKRTTTAVVAEPASRSNGRSVSSSNGARPYVGLSDAARRRQQKSLRKFDEELAAEGVELDEQRLQELRRRAATWPE